MGPPGTSSEGAGEKLQSCDLRPIVADDSHAHHIHEFGEVDRIVHVEISEPSVVEEEHPVLPVSDKSRLARSERWRRLWHRLFRERHLMQYFYNDTLYRTVGLRKVSTEELFLDLVIVAAVAALGHELRESEIAWPSIEKFILLFAAVYNSWRHSVLLWNLWGLRADLIEKAGIYVTFLALTGIALGAHNAFEPIARPYVAVSAFAASAIPAFAAIKWSIKERLLKNPANRVNQLILTNLFTFVSILPYLIAAFVRSSVAVKVLYWVALGLQTGTMMIPFRIFRFLHRNIPNHTRVAINIELMVEKYEVLTMIVLGETMIGLLFEGGSALTQPGVRVGYMYLSAFLSTVMLYSFQTFYIQIDSSIHKGGKHAIRHNIWAGYMWGLLHMPYHFNLILFATGLSISFRDIAVPPTSGAVLRNVLRAGGSAAPAGAAQFTPNAKWLFTTGWAGSVVFSALLGAMHTPGPRAATKYYRIVVRCVVAVAFAAGMPFTNVSAAWFQGVFALVTAMMSFAEFILVQMDRIGFFRSEQTLFSSTASSGKRVADGGFFDDSASDSSEMDPMLDTEVAKKPPSNPEDIDLEAAQGCQATDENIKALKERLCKGHCKRLIPVKPKTNGSERDQVGFG